VAYVAAIVRLVMVIAALLWALGVPSPSPASSRVSVHAALEPLTSDPRSPVAHDNEIMALAAEGGRLFAATDQWEYASPSAAGQVLVKESRRAGWEVFERTESTRVQALASFHVPHHSLLVTQATVGGRSKIQWLVDRARGFSHAYVLPSSAAKVRSFGLHAVHGVWSVYAGVEPTGILRGTWSPARRTLVFDPRPELTAAAPGSPGLKTQKVTAFAQCDGHLFVTINTRLFRRNDGSLPHGRPRWSLVYQEPAVGPRNSGLRGLTCIQHGHSPALLVSTEGTGNVYRFDHVARTRLTPALEFAPAKAIQALVHTTDPLSYVIAAYNNFETVTVHGVRRQLFGIEWRYAGGCAAGRVCAPSGFDAAACFAIRTDGVGTASYAMRCLSGTDFDVPALQPSPVRYRQAFIAIRTIKRSPFGDNGLFFGGYDCNFSPADGTAWIASAPISAVNLSNR